MFQASKATFLQAKTPHGNTTSQNDKQCYTYNDHWYYPAWQSIVRWSVFKILAFCSVHVTELFRTTAITIAKAFLSDTTFATYIAEVSTFATIRRQRTIRIRGTWRKMATFVIRGTILSRASAITINHTEFTDAGIPEAAAITTYFGEGIAATTKTRTAVTFI